MAKHPRFLGQPPRFYGLTLGELMFLCGLIYFGSFIELNPLVIVCGSLCAFFSVRVLTKRIDVVGLALSKMPKSINWIDEFYGRSK